MMRLDTLLWIGFGTVVAHFTIEQTQIANDNVAIFPFGFLSMVRHDLFPRRNVATSALSMATAAAFTRRVPSVRGVCLRKNMDHGAVPSLEHRHGMALIVTKPVVSVCGGVVRAIAPPVSRRQHASRGKIRVRLP